MARKNQARESRFQGTNYQGTENAKALFKADRAKHERGTVPWWTYIRDTSGAVRVVKCTLYFKADEKRETPLAVGYAICSLRENSNRTEGRKRAHGRALNAFTLGKDIKPVSTSYFPVAEAMATLPSDAGDKESFVAMIRAGKAAFKGVCLAR